MTEEIYKKSVLVVDDDERMLRALDKVLTGEGATVMCSNWAGSAIAVLTEKRKTVDLMIVDLSMPIISGLTTVHAVHNYYPQIPIIVLTAYGSPEVKAECLRQGAAAFLEKPLDSRLLIDAVTCALKKNGTRPNGQKEEGKSVESLKR